MTLEEAINLLPLSLGTWKGHTVNAKKGKFGPYLELSGKSKTKTYVSLPANIRWSSLTKAEATKILEMDDREKKHASKLGSELKTKVLKGPKGWYMRKDAKSKGVSIGDTILDKSVADLSSLLSDKETKRKMKPVSKKKE